MDQTVGDAAPASWCPEWARLANGWLLAVAASGSAYLVAQLLFNPWYLLFLYPIIPILAISVAAAASGLTFWRRPSRIRFAATTLGCAIAMLWYVAFHLTWAL